jgi:hypothetical protein
LRDLHFVHGIALVVQKSAIPVRTAPKPPPNLSPSTLFCDVQSRRGRMLAAIQTVANLGKSASES